MYIYDKNDLPVCVEKCILSNTRMLYQLLNTHFPMYRIKRPDCVICYEITQK